MLSFTQIIYMNVYSGFIGNSPKLEIIQFPLAGEWINKQWHVHRKEYYSAGRGMNYRQISVNYWVI